MPRDLYPTTPLPFADNSVSPDLKLKTLQATLEKELVHKDLDDIPEKIDSNLDNAFLYIKDNSTPKKIAASKFAHSGGGASSWSELTDKPFESIGHTLKIENGELSVDTTDVAEADNTLPITSAGAHIILGNIDMLLSLI